jgi:hypothetical protein
LNISSPILTPEFAKRKNKHLADVNKIGERRNIS